MLNNIRFIPNKTYPKLQRIASIDSTSVKNGKNLFNNHPFIIRNLCEKVGIAVFGPNGKFIGISSPDKDMPNGIADIISEKIDLLRKHLNCKDEEVSAIIFGGVAYDKDVPFSEESCRLVDAMEEGCWLENVEPTIVSGQYNENGKLNLSSYIGDKHISFWGSLIDKIKLSHQAGQQEIRNVLDNIFEYVKIADSSELRIEKNLPARTQCLAKE